MALAFGTLVSTCTGGLIAFRNRDRLHLVLGFTAGVVLAVVAFELLPEIFELVESTATEPITPMVALVAGFLTFHVVERSVLMHGAHEGAYGAHRHPHVGVLSALALAGHSLADGVAIGLAFQVSNTVGFTVAVAVIAHDFADGINTMSVMLLHGNTPRRALWFLLLDAVAAPVGASLTLLFLVSDWTLLIYLGFFAGFLLYIGASDILPEAHSRHPSRLTFLFTFAGVAAIYGVSLAHGH